MRSLEQCKAEAFRRSEEIIKKRKKQRIVAIAACVPLVLCVGMWSALILPAMMPAGAEGAAAPENEMLIADHEVSKEASGNTDVTCATLHQNGEEYLLSPEDTVAVDEILQQLEYLPHAVCKCLPQMKLVTPSGEYGIHLTEGYARCEQGQAKLTAQQCQLLQQIVEKTKALP